MTEKKTIIETGLNLDSSYAGLPELFFTNTKPTTVNSPKLIILNNPLAISLGLNVQWLESNDGISMLAGNYIPEDAFPIAQAYAGHQFGHFTMLGDGRAILLGEQITPSGERFDIQLKGSGRTPYSRGGDGRAALGPMLREYIISEAMYSLGIPSTRSLGVVTTGESIIREKMLPGAVLTRIAASHLRVGTFEYASRLGTVQDLKELADYTLNRHFSMDENVANPYIFLLQEVIKVQAQLLAKWQLVGFIHGVMNTDNMTISGESIDYGPCAFMDTYNPATVFSSIDSRGRYAYGNQPHIAQWNLTRFAEALLPLLHENEEEAVKLAQNAISSFSDLFHLNWLKGMRGKLGLFKEEIQDESLIEELLTMMEKYGADYTNTFLALTFDKTQDTELFASKEFAHWYEKWQERLSRQEESKETSHELMRDSNPAVIPRNHRVEEALDAAVNQGDYTVMNKLLHILSCPYAHSQEQSEYATLPSLTSPYRTFCGT
ncbi:protein adenylyltransferase SelO family protein [Tissierella sp.]|uniref:protein adenylyltransferase SelO n=1 Tax=Tissierella sp. TaxID=41274 RepID=UPI002854582F|nr:YdiU family protein [Tissierella sp.]MDR7855606.1 YdiU family protein [Tissierella sp.]